MQQNTECNSFHASAQFQNPVYEQLERREESNSLKQTIHINPLSFLSDDIASPLNYRDDSGQTVEFNYQICSEKVEEDQIIIQLSGSRKPPSFQMKLQQHNQCVNQNNNITSQTVDQDLEHQRYLHRNQKLRSLKQKIDNNQEQTRSCSVKEEEQDQSVPSNKFKVAWRMSKEERNCDDKQVSKKVDDGINLTQAQIAADESIKLKDQATMKKQLVESRQVVSKNKSTCDAATSCKQENKKSIRNVSVLCKLDKNKSSQTEAKLAQITKVQAWQQTSHNPLFAKTHTHDEQFQLQQDNHTFSNIFNNQTGSQNSEVNQKLLTSQYSNGSIQSNFQPEDENNGFKKFEFRQMDTKFGNDFDTKRNSKQSEEENTILQNSTQLETNEYFGNFFVNKRSNQSEEELWKLQNLAQQQMCDNIFTKKKSTQTEDDNYKIEDLEQTNQKINITKLACRKSSFSSTTSPHSPINRAIGNSDTRMTPKSLRDSFTQKSARNCLQKQNSNNEVRNQDKFQVVRSSLSASFLRQKQRQFIEQNLSGLGVEVKKTVWGQQPRFAKETCHLVSGTEVIRLRNKFKVIERYSKKVFN